MSKKPFLEWLDNLTESWIGNTKPLKAVGDFIALSFFELLFAVGVFGIVNNSFKVGFEVFGVVALLFISAFVMFPRINFFRNGIFGLGNLWFIILGIFGILSQNTGLLVLAKNVVIVVYIIGAVAVVYQIIRSIKLKKRKNGRGKLRKSKKVHTK